MNTPGTDPGPSGDDDLNDAERRLLRAAATGQLVDLSSGDADLDNPARASEWPEVRTVRASLIADLLTGDRDPEGGKLRAVKLRGARITGPLDLEARTLLCPMFLEDCTFDRPPTLKDATAITIRLPGCHLPGLSAEQLRTTGDLELSEGFAALGEVTLLGARIGGQLDLSGAVLTNERGSALSADQVTVGQGMPCRDGFTATGEVRLLGAHIGGQLDLSGARLAASSPATALDLESATVGALFLRPRHPPDGAIHLTNARVGAFYDNPETWPTTIRLRGFVYDSLENQRVSARARLGWLTRHPTGFIPQIYDQLAAVYRHAGNESAARRVAVAKQWRSRSRWNPWNWLLYGTVGYGYRNWLAAMWLAMLAGVGSLVFTKPQMSALVTKPPAFHPVIYTLDVLLPIVDFGQQKAGQPHGAALYWSWALISAGWVLTTAVVAGVAGVLQRDSSRL